MSRRIGIPHENPNSRFFKLSKFGDDSGVEVRHIEDKERPGIEFVGGLQVGIEVEGSAVRQNGEPRVSHAEVPIELIQVFFLQRNRYRFALDQDPDFAVDLDRVVDLFPLFANSVCGEFGDDLGWIENLIA